MLHVVCHPWYSSCTNTLHRGRDCLNNKQLACEECGEIFCHRSHLREHRLTEHAGLDNCSDVSLQLPVIWQPKSGLDWFGMDFLFSFAGFLTQSGMGCSPSFNGFLTHFFYGFFIQFCMEFSLNFAGFFTKFCHIFYQVLHGYLTQSCWNFIQFYLIYYSVLHGFLTQFC